MTFLCPGCGHLLALIFPGMFASRATLAVVLCILITLSVAVWGGSNTSIVSTQEELLSAVTNELVTDIYLIRDITLSPTFWAASLPFSIDRNVTIRGDCIPFGEMSRTLDLAYLRGKLNLLPGVKLTIKCVILLGARSQVGKQSYSCQLTLEMLHELVFKLILHQDRCA